MRVAGTNSPASATNVRLVEGHVQSGRVLRDNEPTESASSIWWKQRLRHRYFPRQGGTFRGWAAFRSGVESVDRGLKTSSKLEGDLITEHDYFDGQGVLVTPTEAEKFEGSDDGEVEKRQGHGPVSSPEPNSWNS